MIQDITTIMWRDWIVLRRRLKKFILSRLVTPVLYLVAFGWGLGRNINPASGTYMDFLVPGIIALNTMNVSYMSVTGVHAERVYHKSLEEYLGAPIEPAAFVVGKIFSAIDFEKFVNGLGKVEKQPLNALGESWVTSFSERSSILLISTNKQITARLGGLFIVL